QAVAVLRGQVFRLRRVAADEDLGTIAEPADHGRPDASVLDPVVAPFDVDRLARRPEVAAEPEELGGPDVALVVIEEVTVVAQLVRRVAAHHVDADAA